MTDAEIDLKLAAILPDYNYMWPVSHKSPEIFAMVVKALLRLGVRIESGGMDYTTKKFNRVDISIRAIGMPLQSSGRVGNIETVAALALLAAMEKA